MRIVPTKRPRTISRPILCLIAGSLLAASIASVSAQRYVPPQRPQQPFTPPGGGATNVDLGGSRLGQTPVDLSGSIGQTGTVDLGGQIGAATVNQDGVVYDSAPPTPTIEDLAHDALDDPRFLERFVESAPIIDKMRRVRP